MPPACPCQCPQGLWQGYWQWWGLLEAPPCRRRMPRSRAAGWWGRQRWQQRRRRRPRQALLWSPLGPWTCTWRPCAGLGATTGAMNPIDVLVIGGQDGLQLLLEGVRLHFGVYIHHCSLVVSWMLVHSCCPQNRVDDESIQMWFIFFYLLNNKIFTWSAFRSWMTMPMKVEEYP